MRTEFAKIGAAFDLMPRITTTGLFDTIFAQQGNYTFTLPATAGTLALQADLTFEAETRQAADGINSEAIAAESRRATAAEALLAPKSNPTLTGTVTVPTPPALDLSTKAVNSIWVSDFLAANGYAPAALSPVISVAGRTGAVTIAHTDITDWAATLAPYAPLASPNFTGSATGDTATAGANTRQLANTAFVTAAVAAEASARTSAVAAEATARATAVSNEAAARAAVDALLAPKASPTFTGTVTGQAGAFVSMSVAGVRVVTENAGTWGINISGQAAYAVNANVAAYATNAGSASNASFATNATNATNAVNANNVGNGGTVSAATVTSTGSVTIGPVSGWAMVGNPPAGFGPGNVGFGVSASASNMLAVGFYSVSDVRFKLEIEDITEADALQWLARSRPVTYLKLPDYGADPETAVREAGFLAQDQVRAGYDRYVATSQYEGLPERIDPDGFVSKADLMLSLNHDNYVAYLTAALQAAFRRIEALEARPWGTVP